MKMSSVNYIEKKKTPWTLTSAVPNLRNMRQSSYKWNSLPNNNAGPILKIPRKSVHAFSRNIVYISKSDRRTDERTE